MSSGKDLVEELKKEFKPLIERIVNHPYVAEVEGGKAPLEKLKLFVKEQFHIVSGDLRNLALYIVNSPSLPIQDFYLQLLSGEWMGLDNLFILAKALGLGEDELRDSEPLAGSFAFTSYFTRLGVYGSPGEIATALIIDFEAWGWNCKRISDGLKKHYGLSVDDTRFLDAFYPISPEFYEKVFSIIDEYTITDENKKKMRMAAKLGLEFELMFWDTMQKS